MKAILLKNGTVVNTQAEAFERKDVLIRGGLIEEARPDIRAPKGAELIDCSGLFVAPGFTDAHLHIESSMLSPVEFVSNCMLHGTAAVMVDPHEIANVFGMKAVDMFMDLADILPLNMLIALPSCVPSTDMEHSGAEIGLIDIKSKIDDRRIYGLAEMMNFPGIIGGFGEARQKVEAAVSAGKLADGHCPGLTGNALLTYIGNGKIDGKVRISSDHESVTPEEAIEKLEAGMYVALRYGTASKDMPKLLPRILRDGRYLNRCMLCSDDLSAAELRAEGHMDRALKRCRDIISDVLGISKEQALAKAIPMATKTPGEYLMPYLLKHDLPKTGVIAKGCRADITVFASAEDLKTVHLICGGRLAARDGRLDIPVPNYDFSDFTGSVNIKPDVLHSAFDVPCKSREASVRCIDVKAGSLITETCFLKLPVSGGKVLPAPDLDTAMITVFERHGDTRQYSTGFVRGLGIRSGAIASTVAHDSHNLIAAGFEPKETESLVKALQACGGGIGVIRNGEITLLPLEIGGLMTSAPIGEVAERYETVKKEAALLGTGHADIFMLLSFLALPVIPKLKITDMGLVDVDAFSFVPLIDEN